MIRPMSKYAFLVFHKEYEDFLSRLQALGVLHITQRHKPEEADELKAINDERLHLKALRKRLTPWLPEDYALPADPKPHGKEAIPQAEQALERYDSLWEQLRELKAQAEAQEVWGDYDMEQLQRLEAAGYRLTAYLTNPSTYTEAYEAEHHCIAVARRGLQQYFVRLERAGDTPPPEAERQNLPQVRLSDLLAEVQATEQSIEDYKAELQGLAPQLIEALEAYDQRLEDQFSFGSARLQGEAKAEEHLVFLEGWLPTSEAHKLETALSATGYYYKACQIEAEDKVPISLENNALVRGFELITRMFSLPNYGEIDQTVFFAPFFMLFFGLCLGDAGYGLIVLFVATFLRYKASPTADKSLYTAAQLLGGSAFALGLLTGSLFGVTLPYAESKDYFLNQDNLMLLSVVLGLVQIFFAKGVAAYKVKRQKGLKFALAPIAWIIFLLTLGVMLALPYLGVLLPEWSHYVLYGVVGLTLVVILLYNNPQANPLANVGSALWTAYNTASGLLGDTLSYIRLFAIGLTGAILGGVFNTLAIDTTEGINPLLRFPLMALILVLGHSINFAIAMIGALVHPIRLTFVEYYKNSEFEGGGVAYNPFKANANPLDK